MSSDPSTGRANKNVICNVMLSTVLTYQKSILEAGTLAYSKLDLWDYGNKHGRSGPVART